MIFKTAACVESSTLIPPQTACERSSDCPDALGARPREASSLLASTLLCFPWGGFASSCCFLNGKVFELRSSLELLSQPHGLRSSACPGVTRFVTIFDGYLSAFHGASSAPLADLATQPRKLALQLNGSLVENLSDLVTQLYERFHRHCTKICSKHFHLLKRPA
jgi:hypothetical protein